MKFILAALLAMTACQPASAQLHRPRWYKNQIAHPHKWKDPKFIAGVGVITTWLVLDSWSTSRGVGMGLHESNPFLGAHPSNGAIARVAGIQYAIQIGLHCAAWQVENDDSSPFWRGLMYTGVPLSVSAFAGRHAIQNLIYESDHKAQPSAQSLAQARAGLLR